VRRVAVTCPSFVADCLETLEEIGVRAREVFLEAGGEELTLLPALNAHPAWQEALLALTRDLSSKWAPREDSR
jgi:ferrochelatase